jgi:hypothetical protein
VARCAAGCTVTHNRKPDALPVEGASIAEALDAVDTIRSAFELETPFYSKAFGTIRSALERAAAEGEAWRAIEEWHALSPKLREFVLERDIHVNMAGYPWQFILRHESDEVFECATRLEALLAAAAWIKAQALPAPRSPGRLDAMTAALAKVCGVCFRTHKGERFACARCEKRAANSPPESDSMNPDPAEYWDDHT